MNTRLWIFGLAVLGVALGAQSFCEEKSEALKGAYAQIVFVQGDDLLILRSGGQADTGDPIGARLFPGDQVQTGSKTSVEIVTMPRRSRLRLSENTVVTIGTLGNDGSTGLQLLYGRLRSKVEKLAGTPAPFTVSTPTYVAGVRGTDFGCDLLAARTGEKASARIYCFEGNVEVTPPEQAAVSPTQPAEGEAQKGASISDKSAAERAAFAPVIVAAGGMAEIGEAAKGKTVDVVQRPIDVEIKVFWKANEFTAVQPDASTIGETKEIAPEALDLASIRKGIKAKNAATGGALAMLTLGSALEITSWMVKSKNTNMADAFLFTGIASTSIGLPLLVYSLSLNPLKGLKR